MLRLPHARCLRKFLRRAFPGFYEADRFSDHGRIRRGRLVVDATQKKDYRDLLAVICAASMPDLTP